MMVCTNSTGSDRLPPFFVGKSKSPRCFQKKSPDALGIRYVSNAKAWFTRDLTLECVLFLSFPPSSHSLTSLPLATAG